MAYTDKSRKRQKQIEILLIEKKSILSNYETRQINLSNRLTDEIDIINKSYLNMIDVDIFTQKDYTQNIQIKYEDEPYTICYISISSDYDVTISSYDSKWRHPTNLEYTDLKFKSLSKINTFLLEHQVDYIAELKEKRTIYAIIRETFIEPIKELKAEILEFELELENIKNDLKLEPGLTYTFDSYWGVRFAKRYNENTHELRNNYKVIKTITLKKLTKTAVYFEMHDDKNNLLFSMRKKKTIILRLLNRENGKLTKECLRKQKLKGIFAEL